MEKASVRKALVGLGALVLVLFLGSRLLAEGAISPSEAANLIKTTKDLQLIDVRTPAE